MEIDLRWVATWPDRPDTHETMGSCKDGPWTIGVVEHHTGAWGYTCWRWAMTCSGLIHGNVGGDEADKDAAKARVEAAYRAAASADPAGRDRAIAQKTATKLSQDAWRRAMGKIRD